jgi:hypothetical protein
MPHKFDTTLTGAAGEHLVLSRLLQRGILAAPAPRGTSKVDILVHFQDGRKPVLLQVKSRQFGSDGGWHMSEKHESIISDEIIYCFVNFEPEFPTVHVVPSAVVADAITREHRIWLDTPGKNGQPHKENSMRRIRPKQVGMPEGWMNQYLEAWEQFT